MRWFRRFTDAREDAVVPPLPLPPADDPADSAEQLLAGVAGVERLVNRSAGRLPAAAVANARRITDVLRAVVGQAQTRPLDVYATMSVRGTVEDYLPTTIRTYLAVDARLLDTPRGAGHTPTQSLMMQLDALLQSATATLHATQNQDADALMTQGNFLRTRFSGSDLDL
ncbi:hypothetical protein [Cellulomonas cellasea]|uniref:Uncharacterized protein n=1 Tax=Cellulomonas cellasea TaxID=43670 RepID=A0A7W4YDI7_9CELL|nr:hypothetical protein [Cellulomonas cellasea]MBB2924742.1 hypothetical protein [Cellulomonas cellasea]